MNDSLPGEVDEPPAFGSLVFSWPCAPVSHQATSTNKQAARAIFQSHLPRTKFLLSGDVKLEIEWMIHEERRYESDGAADVDNVIKPLMDVLCGPEGILIDDNQVQSVCCSWIDSTETDEQLSFCLRFSPDEFVQKEGLVFIEMLNSLCMPLNINQPPAGLQLLIKAFEHQFETRHKWKQRGYDYYVTKNFMSIQRVFHKTRLNRFTVVPFKQLRADIEQRLAR